jgi:integrase
MGGLRQKLPVGLPAVASLTKKRGSKFWFACFRDATGKQHRRSTHETTYKKAMKIAEDYEKIAQKKLTPRGARETMIALYREAYGQSLPSATTKAYLDSWLKTKSHTVAESTLVFYAKGLRKFLEFLGNEAEADIATVTQTRIVEFKNWLAERGSANTANADLGTLKSAFHSAKRDRYTVDDPTEFLERVKDKARRDKSRSRRRAFTIPEIKQVLAKADEEWTSLILFGLCTGQRLGDLVSLKWERIDLARNELRLETGKTGKHLTIPIARPLRNYIDSMLVADKPAAADPVHPNAFAIMRRQGTLGNVSNHFADLLAAAGLREKVVHRQSKGDRGGPRRTSELTFHSLRHTCVTLLKEAGVPQAVVQELVGHDSKEMSALYTHVGREALGKAVAALPEL